MVNQTKKDCMVNLISTIDGFRVVIGSWMIHIAELLVIIISLHKPPVYPTEERTTEATWLFCWLCIMHFGMAVIKLDTMYHSTAMWETITICLMLVCATMNWLCQSWLYPAEYYGSDPQTREQKKFETWLWIEYAVFWATIFTSCIYGLACFLKKPKIILTSTVLANYGEGDFVETHAMQLDYIIAAWAPAFVALFVYIAD